MDTLKNTAQLAVMSTLNFFLLFQDVLRNLLQALSILLSVIGFPVCLPSSNLIFSGSLLLMKSPADTRSPGGAVLESASNDSHTLDTIFSLSFSKAGHWSM